jgi:uncharacterized protein with HEPN domain
MWRDDAHLLDMLIAARRALRFSEGLTPETLAASDLHQNAILHVLQTIGEAARKVSDPFKEQHPEILWAEIVGLRHRLVHDYRRIDLQKVWESVESSVPELIEQLERLIPPSDQPC